MKKMFFKTCSNFKAIYAPDSYLNLNKSISCNNCVYFSSKNCHKDILDEIHYETDIL